MRLVLWGRSGDWWAFAFVGIVGIWVRCVFQGRSCMFTCMCMCVCVLHLCYVCEFVCICVRVFVGILVQCLCVYVSIDVCCLSSCAVGAPG